MSHSDSGANPQYVHHVASCRCGDPEDMHMEGIFANTPGRHCIVAFCDSTDFRPLDVQAHCRGPIRPQG